MLFGMTTWYFGDTDTVSITHFALSISGSQHALHGGQREVGAGREPAVQPSVITCPDTSAWMRWRLAWAPISLITASTSPGLMWVM